MYNVYLRKALNMDNKDSNKTFGVYKDKDTLMIGAKVFTFDINVSR